MREREIERDILGAIGYSVLLAVGAAAVLVLYGSLMTSVEVMAGAGGASLEEASAFGLWATGMVLLLCTAPMLRFLVAELPDRVAEGLRLRKVDARWLGLFALGIAALVLL